MTTVAVPDDVATLCLDADKLHGDHNVHSTFKLLNDSFLAGQQHPEVLFRLGRALFDLSGETTDKAEKQSLLERGLSICKVCLDADPNNFAGHKWYGILLGSTGEFLATKIKIANAFIVRDHFKKAVELCPMDATIQHCLGKWCWNVLQITWLERQAAALLFATPPTSTYEECEMYLLASAKLNEDQVHNSLLLGDLYFQQKQWDNAKKWFEQAASCPVRTEGQKRQREQALAKIQKC